MKLGLLQCDHTLESVRHIAGDYDAMFANWLPAEWKIYDLQLGQEPRELNECDGYVTTGSKASVYDDEPWIHRFAALTQRIHAAGVPYLGVCFGHQMMGHALGGRVAKSPNGWGVGVHTFAISKHKSWMQPETASINVLMSCQDQVLDLPPGAEVLGGNHHCPVGIFRVGRMLGIQGHPEFTPAYAEALLRLRRERIGAGGVDEALATLSHPRSTDLLAHWATNYFNETHTDL